MDIEKMYQDIQNKIKQTSNLEENTYMKDILKQDKLYFTFLNDFINFYPEYKQNDTTNNHAIYTMKLSKVNNVSNNINIINKKIHDSINLYTSSLKQSQREIDNLKQIYFNLEHENIEDLDNTSKSLLNDNMTTYSTQRTCFWIKAMLSLFLLYQIGFDSHNTKYMLLWLVCMVILFFISYIRYYWTTYTTLPTSMVAGTATKNTNPLTCSDSEYGCCPDGVTASTKDKFNCCADSAYGCCPNGTNRSSDGTCGCESSPYGCCADGKTTKTEDGKSCKHGGCSGTQYGCCDDGVTPKNADGSNCSAIENYSSAPYGYCPDKITISNLTGSNCTDKKPLFPSCSKTKYGCCPNGHTISNSDNSNCYGSCNSSEFGCCPNGVTVANKDRSNCSLLSCASSRYGCCPDGTVRNKFGSNCR
jgi:hypothetical protein